MYTEKDVIVGMFYETPEGKIVRTSGWDGRTNSIIYQLDVGDIEYTASVDDYNKWSKREDLKDFPNNPDPILPYVFELFWDMRCISDLKTDLLGHEYEEEIRECMEDFKISL